MTPLFIDVNLERMKVLQFIASHPLTRAQPIQATARYLGWQVGSRLKREHIHEWVEGTRLAVFSGMTGATGNIYCGLHDYADMGFLLHLLRVGDTFIDAGANVGTYSILSSGVCRARSIAFEPDPDVTARLALNIAINGLERLVETHRCALGAESGEVRFTVGRDAVNRVAKDGGRSVPLQRLDDIPHTRQATMIKLDVEGYEAEVVKGARETLASPTLLAVQTEYGEPDVVEVLESAGFVRRWYDPASRALTSEPNGVRHSNLLFVRNEPEVLARIQAAPKRAILGRRL